MSKAVYPGSFNPVHLGHIHIMGQAALFERAEGLAAESDTAD